MRTFVVALTLVVVACGAFASQEGPSTPYLLPGVLSDTPPVASAASAIPANPFPCLPKRLSPVKVRALYLTGWIVGIPSKLEHYAKLADETEVNSYVVDVKDVDGHVGYTSTVPEVVKNAAIEKRYNPKKVVDTFHAHDVRVIARVTCFKDPVGAAAMPELAIQRVGGGVWKDDKGKTWLNPYKREAWAYIVSIAKEALTFGFDEIQFDYVRFPSDGRVQDIDFGGETRPKYEAINGFLAYAREQMPDVIISADVFGIICVSAADTEDIGQYLELVVQNVDYLSPMVYPSHYAFGQIVNGRKYDRPDLEPHAVVLGTLERAKERIAKVNGCEAARFRPYLQDFTATWLGSGRYKSYTPDDVRAQIKAVTDAGYDEWILWNARTNYSEAALKREATEVAKEDAPAEPAPAQ